MNVKKMVYYTMSLVIFLLMGCTTVYRVPVGSNSIYLLQKGSKIEVFDYENKNSYAAKHPEGSLLDLPSHHNIGAKISLSEFSIIYQFANSKNDTLFYNDNNFRIKDEIVPILLPPDRNTSCNGLEIYKTIEDFDYMVKYRSDSLIYFNNQPAKAVYLFEYYAFHKGTQPTEYFDPITLLVAKDNGMVLGVQYFGYDYYWAFCPDDTEKHVYLGVENVIDYCKIIATKRKLRKLLM